jgi:hypothetical protein
MTSIVRTSLHPSVSTMRQRALTVLVAALGLSAASVATAQSLSQAASRTDAGSNGQVISRPSEVRIGYERISLPLGENTGLVGTTYLIDLGRGFSIGPAVYGAITGRRGGLFTLGAEASWRTRIHGPLEFQAGYYAGGGGGSTAPVGGGLMLRPHADLLWNFGRYKAGISASQVRFANGNIDSKQVGLILSADTDFSSIGVRSDGSLPSAAGASGIGFDRMTTVVAVYLPPNGTRRASGITMGRSVRSVGARLERFIDRKDAGAGFSSYWGVEAAGAAGGGVAGYAEYLATLGAETSPWGPRTTLGGRLALGMGGGGDVSVGGGLLMKGSVYGGVRVSRDVTLAIEGGYAKAPNGNFKAPFVGVNMSWALDTPGMATGDVVDATIPDAVRTEWVAGLGTYNAARTDGSTRRLRNVVLKTNRFIADNWYVTAQAQSAYSGQAGGYTVGLVGAGYETPQFANMRVAAEMLIGAAGGGGVSTGGGALLQPMAYLSYKINDSLSARVGAGRIRSSGGQLSSNVGEVLLAYSFGVSARP